jgi:carboxyl-terminal processing protease
MLTKTVPLKYVLIALAPIMLVLGIWLGGHPRWLPGPIADALVGSSDRRVAVEALDIVHDKYYRAVPYRTLTDSAIAGTVKNLDDRFSQYLSAKDYGSYEQGLDNSFTGIGVGIHGVPGGLGIETVYAGSPARRAGIRAGDVIVAVDGKKLAGLTEDAATALIKGREGTQVTLGLRRGRATFVRRVTRATISIPVVASHLTSAGGQRVAYIRLTTFGPRTAHVEMAAAIHRALERKAKGIVFDMRGNGGGLVSEAQLIASMFLKGGPIVTTRGRAVQEQTLDAVGTPIAGNLPTVVLVDRGTASAAEIVAGALQDRRRAELVGTKTFGKGVFQEVMPLSNGGALDITVGQYFLPSGRNLGGPGTKQGAGLKPTVRAVDDPKTPKVDEALDVARAELARKLGR